MGKRYDCEYQQYDKFVPVVDKAVDSGWALSTEKYTFSKGIWQYFFVFVFGFLFLVFIEKRKHMCKYLKTTYLIEYGIMFMFSATHV